MALIGGIWVQPKMQQLHKVHYFGKTLEERAQAGETFGLYHGISESVNLLVIAGLIVYLWSISSQDEKSGWGGFLQKIRS